MAENDNFLSFAARKYYKMLKRIPFLAGNEINPPIKKCNLFPFINIPLLTFI